MGGINDSRNEAFLFSKQDGNGYKFITFLHDIHHYMSSITLILVTSRLPKVFLVIVPPLGYTRIIIKIYDSLLTTFVD